MSTPVSDWPTPAADGVSAPEALRARFGDQALLAQPTADRIPTFWVGKADLPGMLRYLKHEIPAPYTMLYDLTAIDERVRQHRAGQPDSKTTLVYHLLSFERNEDIRLKIALTDDPPQASVPSVTSIWPSANWYEREVFDMFGVRFEGHPNLRRILMPKHWRGHPLRKEYPARATEMGPYTPLEEDRAQEEEVLRFHPEEWGLKPRQDGFETMFLNLGPQHPGTHGVLRLVLQLQGERIVDVVPEIGFHHRAAEKMGERQTWHTYIPYTDRVDYLSGVVNNLAYLSAVEKLGAIDLTDRCKVIRIMLSELFRISNHLVWYGTFAQDVGALSPVFYMFTDRERLFEIVEAVTGGRMHPSWFRIGGVAADLPRGWDRAVRDFVSMMRKHLGEYEKLVMKNRIFKARTQGVGAITLAEAIDWGVTGPNLRACGFAWDWRKKRPYCGIEQFDFEVPTAAAGDCYARAEVRVAEMYQSLRIIEQCAANMPPGPVKSAHPLTTPPRRNETMQDIDTLIDHFLGVSWGPVIPAGEALVAIEATKGSNGYYLVSDNDIHPYRLRIRTPSFAHMQQLPLLVRGGLVSDVLAVLGAMDYVLSDVDR